MAKKFGKFILFTAAVSTAVAAAYYFLQKKEADSEMNSDEDYDDFSETSDEDTAAGSRTYVELQRDSSSENEAQKTESTPSEKDAPLEESASLEEDTPLEDNTPPEDFTPLKTMADAAANAAEQAADTVEEFFDENDENIASEDAEDLEATEELPLSDD